MARKRKPRHGGPYIFFGGGEVEEEPRPRFIFKFEHGRFELPIRQPPEEREKPKPPTPCVGLPGEPTRCYPPGGGEGGGGQEQRPSQDLTELANYVNKVRAELLARGDTREDAVINMAMDTILNYARQKLEEGQKPEVLTRIYRESADTVKKYFMEVWARKGHVEPLLSTLQVRGKHCIAKSTPVQTPAGCTSMLLCHNEGIFLVEGEKAECQTKPGYDRIIRDYELKINKYFNLVKAKAPDYEQRSIADFVRKDYLTVGKKLIGDAENEAEARRIAESLVKKAYDLGGVFITVWGRKQRFEKDTSRPGCLYKSTPFITYGVRESGVERLSVEYYICRDKDGALTAVRIATPTPIQPIPPKPQPPGIKPIQPPEGRLPPPKQPQPIRPPEEGQPGSPIVKPSPPKEQPPIKVPPGETPEKPIPKPPIEIQPIQPPEEVKPQPPSGEKPPITIPEKPGQKPKPPESKNCFRAGGREVCVDERKRVATIDGRSYLIRDMRKAVSYGANEVVYTAGGIESFKPYMPSLGGTRRPCPSDARIVYVSPEGAGMPTAYTLDGRTCHAVFTLKRGDKLTVYLLTPQKPSLIAF